MATTSSDSLKDNLIYLKKKLERATDDETILKAIHKLSKVPITIELLQGTGAGKIMRVMAKKPGDVGIKASSLLKKWRNIVASSQKTTETSSLKENDHPKIDLIKRDSSLSQLKTDKEAKKHHRHSEEKSHTHSNKELSKKHIHSKEKHSEHTNSKSKHRGEKHTSKEEHKLKEKHVSKEEMKHALVNYSKHSAKLNSESSLGKKSFVKNDLKHTSSSKSVSKFDEIKQIDYLSDEDMCDSVYKRSPGEAFSESALNSSDSSVSYEPSPKKAKIKQKTDSPIHKPNNDHQTTNNSRSSSSKDKKDKGELFFPSENPKKIDSKSKVKKLSKKDLKNLSTEEFTSSEATFEACLSFNDIVPLTKKKKSTHTKLSSTLSPKKVKTDISNKKNLVNGETKSNSGKESSNGSSRERPNKPVRERVVDETAIKKELLAYPIEKTVDVACTLPQTQPNYRPLPHRSYEFCPFKAKREAEINMSNEQAIKFTSSRREKTAVYSGKRNKTNYLTEVPSLFEFCTRVLIDNIDDIEYMGVVPYFLLESMLQRCSPTQLYRIEDFNPYLLEDTDILWETHCKRDYRIAKPQENETWRELYWRSHDEREQRLRSVTANISASIANSNPTRKAKLAYVDTVVKPPRDVARKQAKNGTALPISHTVKPGPPSKASPRPTAPSINSTVVAATSSSRPRVEAKPMKPKVAPLMAKTLKSMKRCFRR